MASGVVVWSSAQARVPSLLGGTRSNQTSRDPLPAPTGPVRIWWAMRKTAARDWGPVSYTHLRAHETLS